MGFLPPAPAWPRCGWGSHLADKLADGRFLFLSSTLLLPALPLFLFQMLTSLRQKKKVCLKTVKHTEIASPMRYIFSCQITTNIKGL